MDLSLSDDQAAVLGALESLAKPFAAVPANFHGFALISETLDRALVEGGFLDVAYESDLGAVTAALVVAQLARLPYAAEVAASALVRPLLGAELPRPICLADANAPHRPVRFLAPGASVIVLDLDRVSGFTASAQDVQATETLFGYPVALLVPRADRETMLRRFDVSPAAVRAAWRVALGGNRRAARGGHRCDRVVCDRPEAVRSADWLVSGGAPQTGGGQRAGHGDALAGAAGGR